MIATGRPPGEGREAYSPVVAKLRVYELRQGAATPRVAWENPCGEQPPVSEVAMSQGKDVVITDYTKALIQAEAGQLCRRKEFSPSEREDIEQELWLAVLQQAERFDPARASLDTFLERVVSRAVAFLLRSRTRRKRAGGVLPLSLESDFTTTGEGLKPLSDTISSEDVARWLGTQSVDPMARMEQTEAIDSALARMPERLRDICRRLMTGTVASVARELGISRHQVRKVLEEARPYFEEAGLENS